MWGRPTIGTDLAIYVGSTSKRVHKVDALDGTKLWNTKLEGITYSSPVLDDRGVLYIGTTPGRLYALETESGAIIFDHSVGDTIHATPLLLGDQLYFGSENRNFYAIWRYGVNLGTGL